MAETMHPERRGTPLPETFRFSQHSLQDYVDCARRFQLRYVLMQPWPALITGSPLAYERHLQRSADFHRLAHQHTLGLDPALLASTIEDPELAGWWQTYVDHPPSDLPAGLRRAEVLLTAPLAGYRLVAKFDLLAAEPGRRLVIVDWKGTVKLPSRAAMARRLQTQVYRYLAVEAGSAFFDGKAPAPEQVEMVYWYAAHGGATIKFPYDEREHRQAASRLARLVDDIVARRAPIWPLADDLRLCRFCNYCSLCERNVRPGFLDELEDDLELVEVAIDLEQVAEVEF
ncbi:MAG: PD-(D/E)XK nuclease family protein [Anaerolineae bacterium]